MMCSLIENCKRVDVDPSEYFKEVPMRLRPHPADRVDQLAPHRWKELFGAKPAN